MKANEFVKKVGIDAVKSYLAAYEDSLTDDLKRLVESHELVESYSGLEKARKYLDEKWVLEWTALDGKLSQAICDVESCQ